MPVNTRNKTALRDSIVFAIFGALMFGSKILMEFLPNIHLLGMLIMFLTVVYRARALIPLYIYVFLDGLIYGFSYWWYPYLYVWAILWGMTMLLPSNMSPKKSVIVYPLICGLHGFAFGVLYAPLQALMLGLDFQGMLNWIVMGLPYDFIHGISNIILGTFVYPLSVLFKKLLSGQYR